MTIPGTVSTIGWYAFSYCSNLTRVTIPACASSIQDYAFFGCARLSAVYFGGNAPTVGGSHVFAGDGTYGFTVYYLPSATGWGPTFVNGYRTALWRPEVLTAEAAFGMSTNSFGFTISWADGMTAVVEGCTILSNSTWSPVGTNTFSGGLSYFSDPGWTNFSARFYRVRWP